MKKKLNITVSYTDHSVFTPSKDQKPVIAIKCKTGPRRVFIGTPDQCLVIMNHKKRPKIRNIK